MGLAGTAAKLLASLDLDTRPFETGARRAGVAISGMERRFGKIGGLAKQGLGNLATNLTRIGIIAGGAIAVAVKSGIQSLADLERANQQTAAVIESTGGKAGVTAAAVRELAEAQEKLTTVDDKVVQSGENMLLTFTNIGSDIFPQATKSMVDMAVAMNGGSVEGLDLSKTAIQIGKALNDPIKGATALRRVGVQLTDQQEKQIKKFVESGDIMSAQKVILKELETEFGKAGEAAGQGFGGDMRRFDDALEESRMALATGFLPVIRKVADKLTTLLADPKVQQGIRDFGDTLAGGFDKLLEVGGKLPWAQIGDSLKIAGAGAKTLLEAFVGLPPWIQTAVLTGWGLNKLSGGALGGIIGELGKGLIKGVLGMNAGVVNIKAGVVTGGGPGGPSGPTPTGPSRLKFLGGVVISGLVITEVLGEIWNKGIMPGLQQQAQSNADAVSAAINSGDQKRIADALAGMESGVASLTGVQKILYDLNASGVKVDTERLEQALRDALDQPGQPDKAPKPGTPTTRPLTGSVFTAEQTKANVKWAKISAATEKSNAKLDQQSQRLAAVRGAVTAAKASVDSSRQAIVAGGHSDAGRIVSGVASAIRNLPAPIVRLSVTSNTFIRAAQVAGVYTAAHVGAYNKAGSLI